jgi:hypothetical protein
VRVLRRQPEVQLAIAVERGCRATRLDGCRGDALVDDALRHDDFATVEEVVASSERQLERGVRAAFSKGGACYGCHRIARPLNPASLLYRIGPVNLIRRYLPNGDFNHGIREHKRDAQGRPICTACHKAERSERSTDLLVPHIAQCRACHGRPTPLTATPAGTDCSECHAYHQPGSSARLRSNDSLTF